MITKNVDTAAGKILWKILSHVYKFYFSALANMALSLSNEIEQVFRSKGLIDKVMKIAQRTEIGLFLFGLNNFRI
jgi:uncharacterized membrane protein